MSELWVRDNGEMVECDYYRLAELGVPSDWREPTPVERWLYGEIKSLRERVEKLEAEKVGGETV